MIRTRSAQKLPSDVPDLRREAADHRGEGGDPDRGGDEVLDRQPRHLGEVGEGRLAAVVLPVGVGDEGGGGVEAEVPGAGVEALGVERLDALGAEDQVEHQPGEQAEGDDRARVGLPVLPVVGPHAQHPVGEALDRPEDRGQEDPFALEDLGDVAAEQRHQGGEDDQEDDDLDASPGPSELLTAKQRVAEVAEEQRPRRSARRARRRSYPVQCLDRRVEDREGDEGQCDGDEIHASICARPRQGRMKEHGPPHTDFVKVL